MTLAVICLIAASFGWFVQATRGITYFGPSTDNQKQMNAAAHAHEWRWPSDMHKYAQEKSRMKDGVVLCFALMQKVLRDKVTDHVSVVTCAAAHCVASWLVFDLAKSFWGYDIAFVVFVFYFFSVWGWQVAIFGGHIMVGMMFFLASIWFLMKAQTTGNVLFYLTSGMLFGLTQFSSASSRKIAPMYLAALLFSQKEHFSINVSTHAITNPLSLIFLCLAVGTLIFKQGSAKKVVNDMYEQKAHPYLNQLIVKKEQYPLDHYLKRFNRSLEVFACLFAGLFIYTSSVVACFGEQSLYGAQWPAFLGIVVMTIALLLPNIPVNLKGYMRYYNVAKYYDHYKVYRSYFAKKGYPIPDNFRGQGIVWLIRYFMLINPILFILNGLCLVCFIYWSLQGRFSNQEASSIVFIILTAVSPVLFAEVTGCLQLGRAYFPFLLGQVLLTGYTLFILSHLGFHPSSLGVLVVLLSYILWNVRIWLDDVFPGRMAASWLARDLRKRGIKDLITYNTAYNDIFIRSFYKEDLDFFRIRYIRSIGELKDLDLEIKSAVLIPGVSSKALHMETQPEGIAGKDFTDDPYLNRLMEDKSIARLAFLKYKTFGTSRIWGQESDALSFRDLIMKEVTPLDRWLSHGWLIEGRKIKEFLNTEINAYR